MQNIGVKEQYILVKVTVNTKIKSKSYQVVISADCKQKQLKINWSKQFVVCLEYLKYLK